MLLWFHSDDFENHQGFNIEYEISTDEGRCHGILNLLPLLDSS